MSICTQYSVSYVVIHFDFRSCYICPLLFTWTNYPCVNLLGVQHILEKKSKKNHPASTEQFRNQFITNSRDWDSLKWDSSYAPIKEMCWQDLLIGCCHCENIVEADSGFAFFEKITRLLLNWFALCCLYWYNLYISALYSAIASPLSLCWVFLCTVK